MKSRRLLLVVAAVIATLGVAMVFVYAKGADARAAEQYDTVTVLTVAKGKTIAPGETVADALDAGKVVESEVAQNLVLDGASSSIGELEHTVALTTLYGGEQIVPEKFGGIGDPLDVGTLPLPQGKIGKTEEFDLATASFILPGAEVAIFATQETEEGAATCLLIDQVPVLAVGSSTSAPSEEDAATANDIPPLTLAVTQEELQALEEAKSSGTLSVALLNSESKTNPNCADEDSDDTDDTDEATSTTE